MSRLILLVTMCVRVGRGGGGGGVCTTSALCRIPIITRVQLTALDLCDSTRCRAILVYDEPKAKTFESTELMVELAAMVLGYCAIASLETVRRYLHKS